MCVCCCVEQQSRFILFLFEVSEFEMYVHVMMRAEIRGGEDRDNNEELKKRDFT